MYISIEIDLRLVRFWEEKCLQTHERIFNTNKLNLYGTNMRIGKGKYIILTILNTFETNDYLKH